MDISPLLHALCAVAAQILVGLFTGNWAYGAIAGCTFFIARVDFAVPVVACLLVWLLVNRG
ncbi:MAG: hypothetical protein E7L33_24530 [Escherichia coli]|nr:hypothetical protein [Escherichia coli]